MSRIWKRTGYREIIVGNGTDGIAQWTSIDLMGQKSSISVIWKYAWLISCIIFSTAPPLQYLETLLSTQHLLPFLFLPAQSQSLFDTHSGKCLDMFHYFKQNWKKGIDISAFLASVTWYHLPSGYWNWRILYETGFPEHIDLFLLRTLWAALVTL